MRRSMCALILASMLIATVAPAAVDPGASCLSRKLNAAGTAASGLLSCHAAAARFGAITDPVCLGRSDSRLGLGYGKAESKGGCPDDDGETRVRAVVAGLATDVSAALRPIVNAPSPCQTDKLKAASKRARALAMAHAMNLTRPDGARLVDAVARARAKFTDGFARAETKGGCLTTGDAATTAGLVDSLFDGVVAALHVVTRETVTVPSPATPPNTPGTAGVVVTNPDLITQFGGASFSLNNATYTRWRLGGPARQPDAILVAVPGFGGGAANFEALAENLVGRALEEHGLLVEVWGYDRRSEQLEDRAGVFIAGALGDPLVALDWFYGNELGLTLHPALVAGPNRRAVFYNNTTDVPFIANWTPLVFSRDIDTVVGAARAVARNQNVFLGGHSAGTGFAARYAATDFDLTGLGPADPGHAHVRGLVLFEGGGAATGGAPLASDTLDRIEAKFDGGLFGAVRDGAPRCVDGTTACTVANEAADCVGQVPPVCTPPIAAHGVILNLSPKVLAAAEPGGIQGLTDPDTGQAILQVDQGAPGNNAIDQVPELAILGFLPAGTVEGLFGRFLDDDGVGAGLAQALATSMGADGPTVGGLVTWLDRSERAQWPGSVLPNNGPPPTTLPGGNWGQEKEVVRIDRFGGSFTAIDGANASDWYYPLSGLSTTAVAGVCSSGTCTAGNVGASCSMDAHCSQAISLDSTALSVGRGRRDIENLTQAATIDVPVLCIGGSNGLTPVSQRYLAFAQSIGVCTAPSCDGTPRVVDASLPNPVFPTFGGVAGGFEVVIAEGFAHLDVVAAEDDADNPIVGALAAFLARNAQ